MAKSKKRKGYNSRKSKQSMMPIFIGAIGIFVVLGVAATLLSTDESTVYGEVSIEGDLPTFAAGSTDSAVGMPLPEISGSGFEGNAVSITNDGRPKLLLNLAHW